jgi:16S rRNA (cytosine967-C5)-methyltransferase
VKKSEGSARKSLYTALLVERMCPFRARPPREGPPLKPESLLGITLELIGELAAPGRYPADARAGRFFRRRRYLGSRDRRFIGDAAFGWLRHYHRARARWRAWCRARGLEAPSGGEGEGSGAGPGRLAQLLDVLALARDGLFPWDFQTTAAASRRLPEATEPGSSALLELAAGATFLDGEPWPADPLERFAAEVSLPLWLAGKLLAERGEAAARRLAAALLEPASLDLRVNLRLVGREEARRKLEAECGTGVEPTHFSPLGLRLAGKRNLTATTASRRGWVEVQDEGSQIAVLCAGAEPGWKVIDACAGSGGKTLALADIIFRDLGGEELRSAARGRILACDVAGEKLLELRRRAADAGVEGDIETLAIAPAGPLPPALEGADLVVVDAPCSGLGTLRRNPELKLRYSAADIEGFSRLQLSILERFAPLVRPGGRLVYITCSFLEEECGEVASRFEAAHPELAAESSEWAEGRLPRECFGGPRIRLDPVLTRTDAFFIARWRKSD